MRAKRGFTLIELLIVVIIISIVASIALISFGDFGASRQAQVSCEQFSNYLKMIQQRALFEVSTLQVQVSSQGFETKRLALNKKWESIPGRLFLWQYFPKNVLVTLPTNHLNIIITSSGEMTPFKLSCGTSAQPRLTNLLGQSNGDIIIRKDGS